MGPFICKSFDWNIRVSHVILLSIIPDEFQGCWVSGNVQEFVGTQLLTHTDP